MAFSTKARDRYNSNMYARYTIRVNKETDELLYEQIEEFMSCKGTSLNYLVLKLLREHFIREEYAREEYTSGK